MIVENQFFFKDAIRNIEVTIKREDLIHPFVCGNKFRKLKYNLLAATAENKKTILTFGGAFSNHIAAVAYAGKANGFRTIGIIRGEELWDKVSENPTLQWARDCGMQLEFVTRSDYQSKNIAAFEDQLSDIYIIPEGGTNALAIKGCEEILTKSDAQFDYICCSVGTGGTIAGLINSILPHQKILGFPALKGDFLKDEIRNFVKNKNWALINDYHFGGYGKVTSELVLFMNGFFGRNQILLDPIYTAKMVFGVMDLIQKDYFPEHSKILMIHTGGIQGIKGMNIKLQNKQLPLIDV
jgi:1-aminocyclopropane-1-carboxylate deaminase